MNLFFLKHEKKVYLDLKEALLIRREENVLILRRLCTDFQKRRKCTKFEKLMYIFVIKKKNLRRREEFKKKMYIPIKSATKKGTSFKGKLIIVFDICDCSPIANIISLVLSNELQNVIVYSQSSIQIAKKKYEQQITTVNYKKQLKNCQN